MKKLHIILAAIALTGMSFMAIAQTTDSKQQKPKSKEEMEMEKAWMAYMTPGPMHEMLAKDNGEWNADITMWHKPGGEPDKMTSAVTNQMIFGNRYQESRYKGMFMGQPWEGVSTTGYDNAKKMFVSSWYDNMGTGIMYSEGKYDAANKTTSMKGKGVDPITGKDKDYRHVVKVIDDKSQLMEFYEMRDGKEFKHMEIKLTRK